MRYIKLPEVKKEPFTLIGIVASEPLYFVAGVMHRGTGLDFRKVKDYQFYNDQQETLFACSTYIFMDAIEGLLYLLFSNDEPIIKSLKTPDCIMMIIGRDCQQKTDELLKKMHNLPNLRHSKQYFYSESDSEQDIKDKQTAKSDNVQLDLFGNVISDPYQNIKKKREKAVKKLVLDKNVIENLREDLVYNLYEEELTKNPLKTTQMCGV